MGEMVLILIRSSQSDGGDTSHGLREACLPARTKRDGSTPLLGALSVMEEAEAEPP